MMIKLIVLFFPTFITLNILRIRTGKKISELAFNYPIYNIIINTIALLIVYIYNKGEVLDINECFNSLKFSLKYLSITILMAIIIPYLYEFLKKNCNVLLEIKREKNEKKCK